MNCCRETCHRATAGWWLRGVPKRYVAGADTRGRQEGRPYPWSQQVIHEISGLEYLSDCAHPRYGEVSVTSQQYGGIFYPKVV